jgi:CubicO group peptidase (beta-lactamase class C family)
MNRIGCWMAAVALAWPCAAAGQWRDATPEQAAAAARAFAPVDEALARRFTDVESVVVVQRGRLVYEAYRDGDPERLRDTQSVTKSALAALVGVALQQGMLRSVDEPVLALMPEWAGLHADPRAASITLAHLLGLTAGFDVADAAGTAPPPPPREAWSRPLRDAPGQRFAYDNASPGIVLAVLHKLTGQSMEEFARRELVVPLGMKEPTYRHGLASLRTRDMAKLGLLFLQRGRWEGRPLVPAAFVESATRAQSAGGPPARLRYGLGWWVTPSGATYLASGYAGQLIWVHPAQELVVAVTSTVSPGSQQRGQAVQLTTTTLFEAAAANPP